MEAVLPTVAHAKGVASSRTGFLTALEDLAVSADLTRVSATRAVLHLGDLTYTLTGSVFSSASVGGIKTLTGGTLDKVVVAGSDGKHLTVTEFALDLSGLRAATVAERTGTDIGAVEQLLFPLGWHYTGNGAADNLAVDASSGDGVPVHLNGND